MRHVKKIISMMMHTNGVHFLMMWIVETDPVKMLIIVQRQQRFQQPQRTVVHLNKRLTALQQDLDIGLMSSTADLSVMNVTETANLLQLNPMTAHLMIRKSNA